MLDPFGRGAIIALSALCLAGTFALAPIRGRPSSDPTAPWPQLGGPVARDVAVVTILRDPFAEPTPNVAPASLAAAAPADSPRTIGTLPANLPSETIPAVPGEEPDVRAARPRVTAIVTGAHPYAMLELAGVHEIKGVGDAVAGSVIRSIGLDGVRLQNGADLAVDSADSTEPPR